MNLEILKTRLWMWGPFLFAALITLLLLLFAAREYIFSGGSGHDGERAVYPYGSIDKLMLRENFKNAYLAANGGIEALAALQSVRYRGNLEKEGSRIPFMLIKKRPWQSSLTLKFPSHELSFLVDDETVWQRLTAPGKKTIVNLIEGDEALSIKEMGAFFDPVMMLILRDKGVLHEIKEGEFDSRPMIVLDFENKELKLQSQAYIDPKTMYLLARVDRLPDGSERKLFYQDHKKVAGLLQPFNTLTYINDELDNRVTIEKSDNNIGTYSSFFKFPGATEQ